MLIRTTTSRRRTTRLVLNIAYESRVFLMALAVATPGLATAIVLLWRVADLTTTAQWEITAALFVATLFLAGALRRHIVVPLQTVANLIAALREGDFSVRGREGRPGTELTHGDTLEELTREVNALAQTVYEQRLGAVEATTLLRKVMEEIDVAVFAFDAEHHLKLLNRAAERLINTPAERALGQSADMLGLSELIQEDAPRLFDAVFPGGSGRWELRRSVFRQGGLPHQMLVVSDLTRTLREQELQAWQRIVRVIGHELNNSLAPIKSISGSLQSLISRPDRATDWEEDLTRGLAVISTRSEALGRFMAAYARLARLPQPRIQTVDVGSLIRRVAGLETRIPIAIEAGPEMTVPADPDQLEQLLINLVRNAADASLETGGGVSLSWKIRSGDLEIRIDDEGPGLSNTSNLFVPFFTTKPGGSGIGLVLSRQIAEAHGGALRLENHLNGKGCAASLRLPL
jgi:nitrogen fixation/metabolism regulation signal transduction histidine kinase